MFEAIQCDKILIVFDTLLVNIHESSDGAIILRPHKSHGEKRRGNISSVALKTFFRPEYRKPQ